MCTLGSGAPRSTGAYVPRVWMAAPRKLGARCPEGAAVLSVSSRQGG